MTHLMHGVAMLTECSIGELDGVQVAEVGWASDGLQKRHADETTFNLEPEVCVKVLSSSNSKEGMKEKITRCLVKGAREVWLCDHSGKTTFNHSSGKLKKSKVVARVSSKV